MNKLVAMVGVLALFVLQTNVEAQTPTCPIVPTEGGTVPSNETWLTWDAVTTYTDVTPILPGLEPQYVVYRRAGTTGSYTIQCITTAGVRGARMQDQPTGTNYYAVVARMSGTTDSLFSNGASKESTPTAPVVKQLSRPTNLRAQ